MYQQQPQIAAIGPATQAFLDRQASKRQQSQQQLAPPPPAEMPGGPPAEVPQGLPPGAENLPPEVLAAMLAGQAGPPQAAGPPELGGDPNDIIAQLMAQAQAAGIPPEQALQAIMAQMAEAQGGPGQALPPGLPPM